MVDSQPSRDALAAAWSAVLGGPASPDADFYALGGDSLAAMRIATQVAEATPGVDDLDALVMTEILDLGRFGDVDEAVAAYLATV